MASGHRPVPAQSLRGHFALSHGDHPVCSYVSPTGGLDGLHRSWGGVSSGSCASGFSSLPTLCGSWPRLPIHSVVLRSVHGPAGLHLGYGSCIRCSSFLGYPYASLPGRLARPGIVPGGHPPGSRGCLVPLSRVGDRGQPGVVQLLSVSGGTVSRGGHRYMDFYGFSIARSRLQAAVYLRRILSFRSASCQLVAVASGDAVLFVTSGSRGLPADEFAPDLPSPLLGSVGSFGSGAVVSGLSPGPSVVASQGSLLSRCVSPAGVPSSGLLVRRFRRRLGDSLGRQGCFRPVGPVGGSSSCQCQGVAGCASRSPPLPVLSVRDHGGRVLRQCHRGSLSTQGGGAPGILLSTQLGGISSDSTGFAVHSGDSQCSRGLSLLSSPAPQFRMVSQHGRISIFAASVAGGDRPVCPFRQSPLLHLFSPYRDPLSAGTDALLHSWDGLLASLFHRGPFFPRCWRSLGCLTGPSSPSSPSTGLSVLGSWTSSSDSFSMPRPPLPASVSSTLPGSPQAGPSCLRLSSGSFLLGGSCTGFIGAPSIIVLQLPAQVIGLPVMVPLSGPLHLAALPLQGSGFPLVAPIGSRPYCLLHQGL